jgi:hypothetical protein
MKLRIVTEKRCPICGEMKPAAEFYSVTASLDGLSSYCKPCAVERQRGYREAVRQARQQLVAAESGRG